ncbi:MAG: hypothetical protein IH988_09680 [Planctomycetes bacterium]|nr:hypothetical protein [Planctomycetota bacterium]
MRSQWRCGGCGSLLEFDGKRRMLTVALSLVSVAVIAYTLPWVGLGGLAIIPVIFGVQWCFFLLLDRGVVFERRELHCHGCGYDLRGQVASRCPECGAAMDDTQRQILETGRFDPVVIRRRPTVSLGFIIFLIASGVTTASLILVIAVPMARV